MTGNSSQRRSGAPHRVLMLGQTPPPFHGQAIATQILFEHRWPGLEIETLRMAFSEDMESIGRLELRKLFHLFGLIRKSRRFLRQHPDALLFYPPASARWVPFLRDVVYLSMVRPLAAGTVFIFHAGGLATFASGSRLRRWLSRLAYSRADMSLEVAMESPSPHGSFAARGWQWCPCGIDVPAMHRSAPDPHRPLEVLFLGGLQEGKGVLEILRTADTLRALGKLDRFHFRIVGPWVSDAFQRDTLKTVAHLNLEQWVSFPGQLTGDAKWDAYRRADIFFFPTHYASEASPIVLMEALGSGLPIVSTEWRGIPAIVDGCSAARLAPVREPKRFADALLEFEGRRAEFPDLANDARMHYEHHFRPETFVGRVQNAFLEVGARLAAEASERPLEIAVYLADQNPRHDRSIGISRMSETMLQALARRSDARLKVITSRSSQQGPEGMDAGIRLPWSTRAKLIRMATDHLHPLMVSPENLPDVWYYPKGFLPRLSGFCRPSVVTIHDAIIQHYWDNYPQWRNSSEYVYWASALKHTLRRADVLLTVSEHSRRKLQAFMARHGLPERDIEVTHEPCIYEPIPQPETVEKEDYVVHLGSREPHKRTLQLVKLWETDTSGPRRLPPLRVVGNLSKATEEIIGRCRAIEHSPFIEDNELQVVIRRARALILPSEIEGFGLPALEAYYLGTPVCYTAGIAVGEVLEVATSRGSFVLEEPGSLEAALLDVLSQPAAETRRCGLVLREHYASTRFAEKMMRAFRRAMTVGRGRKP